MTHEDQHIDLKVDELLSIIETHAKNVRRQATLIEFVDNLADEPQANHRPLWFFWTGIAMAACMALVIIMRQKDAPQMAKNTAKLPVVLMHEDCDIEGTSDATQRTMKKLCPADSSINNSHTETTILRPSPVEETYACYETESGIRVYCENLCNADEVIAHMEEIVKQSIVAL